MSHWYIYITKYSNQVTFFLREYYNNEGETCVLTECIMDTFT